MLHAHAVGRRIALRTSGTSSSPRAVVRSTESWVRSFDHVAALTGLGTGSRLWLPGPLTATMNLFAATLARHVGATVVPAPDRATHAHLTPQLLQRSLDDGVPLTGVRVTVAGDRLQPSLGDRARAAGAVVTHYYGSAELSFVAWGSDERSLVPFPEVEVQVREGEIWVRSPYLCEGYDGPAGPLRKDPDGFATVGDRGELTGGTLRVDGRGCQAVVTGSATVLVADVEGVLRATSNGDVVVVGVPHGTLGQVVAAVLTDAHDLDRAHRTAAQLLAPPQRPRLWFHVAPLPLTGAGKVDRQALTEAVTRPDAVRLVPRRTPVPS